MARIADTQQVHCPHCGATAIVRIWSCGCQWPSRSGIYGGHNSQQYECQNLGFFSSFKRACGQSGDDKTHQP